MECKEKMHWASKKNHLIGHYIKYDIVRLI